MLITTESTSRTHHEVVRNMDKRSSQSINVCEVNSAKDSLTTLLMNTGDRCYSAYSGSGKIRPLRGMERVALVIKKKCDCGKCYLTVLGMGKKCVWSCECGETGYGTSNLSVRCACRTPYIDIILCQKDEVAENRHYGLILSNGLRNSAKLKFFEKFFSTNSSYLCFSFHVVLSCAINENYTQTVFPFNNIIVISDRQNIWRV